jgi:Uma2 family endonuclease
MASSSSMKTVDYLKTAESNRPRELRYGVVREPPAPFFSHQAVVLRIARVLDEHVDSQRLGRIGVAPIDVVLDADRALIVQPDVLFVSSPRLAIIRNQVWGAPDLVIEVLSRGSESYDRTEKLEWYQKYGVRECWLVDPSLELVTVVDCSNVDRPIQRVFSRSETIRSTVLPTFVAAVSTLFP